MTKDELLKLPEIYAGIERDRKRIDIMRSRLYSPKGLDTRDKVQSSGGNSMLAETVIDLQQKLDARVREADRLRAEADRMISRELSDSIDLALVMKLRYIQCLSWAHISEWLQYSPATLYRYRREALSILFKE